MRKILKLIVVAFLVTSCGKEKLTFSPEEKLDEAQVKYLLNEREASKKPDLQKDSFLANYDYPIEISLYDNGEFYYNLDNLGDGKGVWENIDGILHLSASRRLFNMLIYIYKGEGEQEYKVAFRDRHGLKRLDPKVLNKE